MEPLVNRPVVVALALVGALLSSGAALLQARGRLAPKTARVLNLAGYLCMGASMALFALAGLWGVPA